MYHANYTYKIGKIHKYSQVGNDLDRTLCIQPHSFYRQVNSLDREVITGCQLGEPYTH